MLNLLLWLLVWEDTPRIVLAEKGFLLCLTQALAIGHHMAILPIISLWSINHVSSTSERYHRFYH